MAKTPLGKLDARAFGVLEIPRVEASVLDGFRALRDLTGTTSDALDEAHNLAEPGDVLVVQGIANISSMGGVSAAVGKRRGEAGAVVDGAVRDIDHSRAIGYPVWCSSVSPVTGKWRIRTVAINRPVSIAGVAVSPGDLVIADEVGVCFVPFDRAAEVLEAAQRLAKREEERLRKLDSGLPLKDWIKL